MGFKVRSWLFFLSLCFPSWVIVHTPAVLTIPLMPNSFPSRSPASSSVWHIIPYFCPSWWTKPPACGATSQICHLRRGNHKLILPISLNIFHSHTLMSVSPGPLTFQFQQLMPTLQYVLPSTHAPSLWSLNHFTRGLLFPSLVLVLPL